MPLSVLLPLLLQWAVPLIIKEGPAVYNSIADLFRTLAPTVSREEVIAMFAVIHKFGTLADYENAAGVVVKPDGSVDPQPFTPPIV